MGGLTISSITNNNRSNNGTENFSGNNSFSGGLICNSDPVYIGQPNGGNPATTVNFTGSNDISGAFIINGALNAAAGQGLTEVTTVTFSGPSGENVGAAGSSAFSSMLVNSGGTLNYKDTANFLANRLGNTVPVTLNGGTFKFSGITAGTNTADAASINGLTVTGSNTSYFTTVNASGSGNTATLTIGTLAQSSPLATLSASLPNATTAAGRVAVSGSPAGLVNGIIPWGIETTTGNFLTVQGGFLGGYSSVGGAYSTGSPSTWAPANNVELTTGTVTASASALTINSLSMKQTAATTFDLGGNSFVINSGGILSTGNYISTIQNGALTTGAGNQTFYLWNTGASSQYINAAITDNGSSVGVVKIGSNTTLLGGRNTYSGPTAVEIGTLEVASGGSLGTNGAVAVAPAAGLMVDGGATINGSVVVTGTLTFDNTTSAAVTVGTISGVGGTINYQNTLAAGTTLNFAPGAGSFHLTNTAAGGKLILTGSGSTNSMLDSNLLDAANATATTVFQSGTYNFISGLGSSGSNQLGTIDVTGATLNLSGGARYFASAGGTLNISAGAFNITTDRFSNDGQSSGTAVTVNLSGTGLMDLYGLSNGFNLGNNTGAASFNDQFNQTGGTFQDGVDGSGSGGFYIGNGTSTGSKAIYNLSGGILRSSQTIQAGGAAVASSTNGFNWTGGTLTTAGYNATNLTSNDGISPAARGTLFNGGGTLAPGFVTGFTAGNQTAGTQYTGITTITGNYQVDSPAAALVITSEASLLQAPSRILSGASIMSRSPARYH